MADPEIERFVREWNRTLAEGDLEGAAALRGKGYTVTAPEGQVLDAEQELAFIADPAFREASVEIVGIETERSGDDAVLTLESRIVGRAEGLPVRQGFISRIECRKAGGSWTARRAVVKRVGPAPRAPGPRPRSALRRLLSRNARRLGFRRPRELWARAVAFGRLAYLPYRPGADFILPPVPAEPAREADGGLPVPPERLWTDFRYSAQGERQVATMLRTVEESGLAFAAGDRILDLGCGSGRMIRHLLPLSGNCEIWGLDISAEHILWCQRNLSPPFHFATTTKVPHLPFGDSSFRFIYCGSLFTHIDDLADAWLLELRRLLAPDGRLYLTLHDERTVALFEEGAYAGSAIVEGMRSSPTYARAVESGFSFFTIGRDSDSQVFYHRDWFRKRISPAFDLLTVVDRAYYYQQGYLLAPKVRI